MTQLIRGKKRKPLAMVIYGVPGVGKSSLAAGAPNPIFLGPEENDELSVLRFPKTTTYAQVMSYLDELIAGKHKSENIQTVVLDSIDAVERLITKEICDSEPGKTMETARKGYGKAWSESAAKLWALKEKLVTLRDQGQYNIIVIGHSIKNKFSDPLLATEYDTFEMCLHKGKKMDCNSFFIDWASTVLFCNWKNYKSEDGNYAVSLGKREILTEYRPSHIAKNRFNFPYSIDMLDKPNELKTFGIIMNYIDQFYNSGASANTQQNELAMLIHKVKELMTEIKDEKLLPTIEAAVNSSINNFKELTVIHDRLREIVSNQ
jgi:hypothetical protein